MRKIHIVLASPGDVKEREAFEYVVKKANLLVSDAGLILELRKWEDIPPGFDPRGVQPRIEDHLEIGICDILVGLFWKRFGLLDAKGESRTEREIRAALRRRESGHPRPDVMVYFCTRPYTIASSEEAEDLARVLRFKEHLHNERSTVQTKDYADAEDFKVDVLVDLMRVIGSLEGARTLGRSQAIDRVFCFPSSVRNEGCTEKVNDVRIEIEDPAEGEPVTISLLANTNVTNRIVDENLTDVVLVEGTSGHVLGRGRLVAGNAVQFEAITLKAHEPQDLVITGVRLDAAFLGMGSTAFPRSYTEVEVALAYSGKRERLTKHRAIVAYVERSFDWVVETDAGFQVDAAHAFIVRFRELLPGAFKTRQQECGDHGTILALHFSLLPRGSKAFVTLNNILSPGTSAGGRLSAALVDVDANGAPTGGTTRVDRLEWPGGGQMSAVPFHGLSAWEIVAATSPEAIREVSVGVIVRVPPDQTNPHFDLHGSLAPLYVHSSAAHSASASLPVPRFDLYHPSRPQRIDLG